MFQPNDNSISTWKQAIAKINNNDGTLHQSIRWSCFHYSHHVTRASVNINHTVIRITTTRNEKDTIPQTHADPLMDAKDVLSQKTFLLQKRFM